MKFLTLLFLCFIASAAIAGPGAHGPNGEHLDAPAGQVQNDAAPRIETFTETFELVGRLHDDELSILIDRYDTNEPVLNGKLDVELGDLKATAKFHADHGDYAIDDPAFMKALARPGKHPLVFTLVAGEDSDLLEATLTVAGDAHPEHRQFPWIWAIAGVLASLVAVTGAIKLMREPSSRKSS